MYANLKQSLIPTSKENKNKDSDFYLHIKSKYFIQVK